MVKDIPVYEFDLDKVIKHAESLPDLTDKKDYYQKVLEIKKNNKTIIDHSIGDTERDFVQEIKSRITAIDEELAEDEELAGTGSIVKITGKYGPTDITRIFEAMSEAGIISKKTEVTQIARIFFADPKKRLALEKAIHARKKDTVEAGRSSNSEELLEFTKILISKSFHKKDAFLEKLVRHIEDLQKKS